MTRAVRASWPVALTSVATVALVLLAAASPATAGALPFVGRVAELALAGGLAYLIDDAATQLTSVTPQGRWKRRAPVLGVGATMLASAWLGVQLVLWWRDARLPVAESFAELLVMGVLVMAAATLLMRFGDPEPGVIVAPMVVVAGLGLTIVESLVGVPVYLAGAEPTLGRVAGWCAAGALAVLVMGLCAGEPDRVMRRALRRV